MNPNNKSQMHPDDIRNFIIFCVISALLYFVFDVFILKPQKESLKEYKKLEQEYQAQLPPELKNDFKPREKQEVLAEVRRIRIENDEISGSISLAGGRIDDIELKQYYQTLEEKQQVTLLSPPETNFPRYIEHGWVAGDQNLNLPDSDTIWDVSGNDVLRPGNPVTLRWDNGQGLIFFREMQVDDHYMITVRQSVTNNMDRAVTLHPYGLVAQTGIPDDFVGRWLQHEGPIGYIGEELHELTYSSMRKEDTKSFKAVQGWTGITDKYWLTALIPPQGEMVKYSYHHSGLPPKKKEKDRGRYQADFTGTAITLAPGETGSSESRMFAGAKRVLLLEKYEDEFQIPYFDLAVNFGWFWFFSKPFFYALHYLGLFTGNMGIAIILLTIGIRSAVFPLTNKSYTSFAKMKKVTPQIVELRNTYSDDKQQLQKELVKLYERESVNPMSGCFPILLQIPIFFALYKVIFVTIELRHAPFFGWIKDLSEPDPSNVFELFGLLPWGAPEFLHVGAWPCVMLVMLLFQKKLNPPPQDPLQRDMMLYFPIIITYVMAQFASGLVIYWTFSAFIGIIQQIIIMRSMDVPIYLFGQTEEEEKLEEQVEKGPAVHPLVEMAEEDVEEAMFGDHDEKSQKNQAPQKSGKKISKPKPKKSKKRK